MILDHLGFISDFGLYLFLVFNSFHLNKFAFGYIGFFFSLVTAVLVGKVLILLLEGEIILKFIH